MAENYSLNSQFGLNVSTHGANIGGHNANNIKNSKGLLESIRDLSEKYENVFNGNVEREINAYSRQAMILGMNLQAGETKHRFDMNI